MDLESVFYEYLERFRTLLAAETWRRLAMEMSKNDLLSLLYLHRAQQSRMGDLAEYLDVPLNTATGVVARLQRRGLVEREHSPDDLRIVLISLSDEGRTAVTQGLRQALALADQVVGELSREEFAVVLRVLDRVVELLTAPAPPRPVRRRIPID